MRYWFEEKRFFLSIFLRRPPKKTFHFILSEKGEEKIEFPVAAKNPLFVIRRVHQHDALTAERPDSLIIILFKMDQHQPGLDSVNLPQIFLFT